MLKKRRRLSGIFLTLFTGLLSVFLLLGFCVWLLSASYQKYASSAFEGIDFEYPGQKAVNTALGVAQWGGSEVLIKWLREDKTNTHPTVFVLNKDGIEISGRAIPEKALKQVANNDARITTQVVDGENLRFFAVRLDRPKRIWSMTFWRTPWWVHALLALFSTAIVAGLLAWNFAKPIRKLDWAMRRAADGNLEDRIAPLVGHNYDEIGDLAKQYDAMAEKITGLLARQKTLFHDVSHELRSPLARIDVALALIEKDPANRERAIKRIEAEVELLDNLVEALLTYARLDENAPISYEEADLSLALEAIVSDADFEGSAKDVHVTLESDPTLMAKVHMESISSALENLVRNALRFSKAGDTVRVIAHKENGAISIAVQDAGPGIPAEDLERLFEPFARGKNQATGSGFGLGLAIAKRAVERHNGTLSASNLTPHGLEMRIELPVTLS